MSWESRDRGSFYYTRSYKVDGRVVREYVGGGVIGTLAARIDAGERQRREQRAAVDKEEREQIEALIEPIEELCEQAETLARAALIADGSRRHGRGEWRRRRG